MTETSSARSSARNSYKGNGSNPPLRTVQEGRDASSHSANPRHQESDRNSRRRNESGSDSGGHKRKESKRRNQSKNRQPGEIISKKSFASLPASKGKSGEATPRNMIVEEETVNSVPQASLGVGQGERNGPSRSEAGVLRNKLSDETIKPKKEKKRSNRKQPTSSRAADIFEARLVSNADGADSSDSGETFVYESNPPDSARTPYRPRFQSRTPSVTSTTSVVEPYNVRPRLPSHGIAAKRSMKFTNANGHNYVESDADLASVNGSQNQSRNPSWQTMRTTNRGRDLPRPPASPTHPARFYTQNPYFLSHQSPSSPSFKRLRHMNYSGSNLMPSTTQVSTNASLDDGEGADDERAPLVGHRSRHGIRYGRRPIHNYTTMSQNSPYVTRSGPGWFERYAFCGLLLAALLMVIVSGTFFIVLLAKPLSSLHVVSIDNVLASNQELMLDLDVRAINPNLFTLAVSHVDVNIFAKSTYVGNDETEHDHEVLLLQQQQQHRRNNEVNDNNNNNNNTVNINHNLARASDNTDDGTDPIPVDRQTMLLGRVFFLDAPLSFEASPWNQEFSQSIGQIRLTKPGNATEEGGTARWERVLQHTFELIVRGVVQYQLPLGDHYSSAMISASTQVQPHLIGR